MDEGIVVIRLDTASDPDDAADATITTDNFKAGATPGAYTYVVLGDKAVKLIMLDGISHLICGAGCRDLQGNWQGGRDLQSWGVSATIRST